MYTQVYAESSDMEFLKNGVSFSVKSSLVFSLERFRLPFQRLQTTKPEIIVLNLEIPIQSPDFNR